MNLSMRQAAEQAGLSYERFRKVWRDLAARDGFPMPVRARVWDASQVNAWRVRPQAAAAAPLHAPSPAPVSATRLRNEREALRALRAG